MSSRPTPPLDPSPDGRETPPLILGEWDVLFSYITYFEHPLTDADFHRLAGSAVRSGLADVVYHSSGLLAWFNDGPQVEAFDVPVEPYIFQRQATGQFPAGLTPYQGQCALHATQQRFYERQSLTSWGQDSYAYFRAFLSPCELIIAGRATILYPTLTVHHNGVVQASFRVLNGEEEIPVQTLIDDILTLPRRGTQDIFVPPALVRLDAEQLLGTPGGSRRSRAEAVVEVARITREIQQHQVHRQRPGDDFGHVQVSLRALAVGDGPQASLTMLASMLFNATEALANPRSKQWWRRARRGARRAYRQGQFWTGRPHVYLRSTIPHPESAAELAETHAESFGRILARTSHLSPERARNELGTSLRLADDYLTYVGRAASLSVYSAKGLRQHVSPDPHGNELIYRLQAKADFADFIAGSYFQCEEVALRHARTVEDLIANRERQTLLEQVARRPFASGELNDWFGAVMDAYDIKSAREAIALNTTLKLEKFKEDRNLRRQQFQWLMAALFGVVAASTTGARGLVRLFWEAAGGPTLGDPVYTLMAMALVTMTLWVAYQVFVKQPPRRST